MTKADKTNKSSKKKPTKKKTAVKKSSKPKHKAPVKIRAATQKQLTFQQELEQQIQMLTESNRQHKRKIFDLYTIFEISRNFNALLDYQQLLDTFIFTSLAQVGAMKAAFYLLENDDHSKLVLTKHKGSGEFPSKRYKFKRGSQLLDNLTKMNRPTLIDRDILSVANKTELKILKEFENGLLVPLLYQTELSGIFIVSNKHTVRTFTSDDIEFMSILGNQISVAIENTRLYEAEKKSSMQLRETQEQLVHSERLAALGEMSAKVAHEINNPLGIIKNYLQLTKNRLKDENTSEYLSIVNEEIDRIAKIVAELLDFHRPKGYNFQTVSITELADSVISLMTYQFKKKKIVIERNYQKNIPDVEISPEGIKQVFLNLIINAYDAVSDYGILRLSIKSDKEKIMMQFCDSGPGIPPELVPRVFEPFFTTKDPDKGTGLGLSVCYGIIKKHNGSITYKNKELGGCFEIKLPIKHKATLYESGF
ncbi:MAG: GHKL domain-containing protein [Calditrichaeota bacterium]|nr:MAG: GHKL domain-containing protein [Calditrichota bacterium]